MIWYPLRQTEQTRVSVDVLCDRPRRWPCVGRASTAPAQEPRADLGWGTTPEVPAGWLLCFPTAHHERAIHPYVPKQTRGTPSSHTYPQQGYLSARSLRCWFDPFSHRMRSPDPSRPRGTHQVSF